jgi:hypothetical protein
MDVLYVVDAKMDSSYMRIKPWGLPRGAFTVHYVERYLLKNAKIF